MLDRNLLPVGSTLVALIDKNEVNNSSDFSKIPKYLENFNDDLSSYNILQVFLATCLKNRFHSHIGVAGSNEFSLDDLLKSCISNPLDFDFSHFESLGSTKQYKEIFDKIVSGKSEWSIYAAEYGIALSIILNNLKNTGYLNCNIDNVKNR